MKRSHGNMVAHATQISMKDPYERKMVLLLLMVACLMSLSMFGCYSTHQRPLPMSDQRRMSKSSSLKCSQFGTPGRVPGYRGWRVVKVTRYYALLKKGRHTVQVPCK